MRNGWIDVRPPPLFGANLVNDLLQAVFGMLSPANVWKPWWTTIIQSGEPAFRRTIVDPHPRTTSSYVRFSPNSRFVLASTQDSTIRLWNYQTSKCVKTYIGHSNRTYCIPACFVTSKGKYIVSGSEDNKIYIWDLQTRQVLQVLEGHRGMWGHFIP